MGRRRRYVRPPPAEPTLRTHPPVLLAVTGRHASRWGQRGISQRTLRDASMDDRGVWPKWRQAKMLTAREMTKASVMSEASDCSAISSFAHPVSGIVSVGLNAVALVNDVYR